MSYIKSRKHAAGALRSHPTMAVTAALAAGLAMNLPAHAQTAPANTAAMPEISVSGQADTADYKADTLSSPKFTEPLVDTTRTVTVIKESLFKEQVATTLTEALRNTPGVGTFYLGENGATSTGDAVFMRGFDASSSIFVDGIRDVSTISRDVFNIESIEVIKGPAGTDYGRTSPTGSINLVSKQPKLEDSAAGSVSLGTSSQRRVSADLNRRLEGWDGAAFRLNVVKQDSDVPGRDRVNNNRLGIAPSLAFGLNTDTRVFLNFLHVEQHNIPDGGVPTIGLPGYTSPDPARSYITNAGKVRSSNFYGTTSDFDNAQSNMLTGKIERDLGNGAMLSNITRYGRTTHDYMLTSWTANNGSATAAPTLLTPDATNPATWTVARNLPTNVDQTNTIVANQTNIRGESTAFGLKHSWTGGVELSREEQVNYGFNAQNVNGAGSWPAANLYNPDPNVSGYTRTRNGVRSVGETKTIAAYAFDTIKLSERWAINGGLRYDHYKTDYQSSGGGITPIDLSKSGNLFGWKLGALYKPAENGSIYAAYGVSAQPPGGNNFLLSAAANNANNSAYDPQKAKSAEVGTKWDLLNKQLGVAATLYRTEVTNEITQDPVSPTTYLQTGKKRVQGVELSAVGQITKAWAISSGFTTMNTAVTSGANVGADGASNALNYTPKVAFTVWSTYKTPLGVTVGGGARYNGKLQRGSDGAVGTPKYTDSYVVFDAVASYRVNKNLDLQLNIYNLFDKEYVAAINKSGFRYTPGVARYALLSANFRF